MLEKEEEGRIGAWGIASGFEVVEGLVLDLGGKFVSIPLLPFRALFSSFGFASVVGCVYMITFKFS